MAAVTKYQCVLYFFNLLLLVLGGYTMYLGFLKEGADNNVQSIYDAVINPSVWTATIIAGAVFICLGFLGCCGACRAKDNVKFQTCSCTLWLYGFVTFLTLVLVAVVLGVSIYFIVLMQNSINLGYNVDNPSTVDTNIQSALQANSENWIYLQDTLKCCGWANTNTTAAGTDATGQACFVDPAPDTCRTLVLTVVKESITAVSIVSGALTAVLMLVLTSVCCLTCCSSKQDAVDTADYRRMPGGHARGAGFV